MSSSDPALFKSLSLRKVAGSVGSEMLRSPSFRGWGWNRSVAFFHLATLKMFLSGPASAMILSQYARFLFLTVRLSSLRASAWASVPSSELVGPVRRLAVVVPPRCAVAVLVSLPTRRFYGVREKFLERYYGIV